MKDKILRDHLVNLVKGGQAFVTADDALSNIKPGLRNKRPAPGIHSVWESLEHMRIAQEDILKYTIDPGWKSPDWPSGYWPDKNTNVNDETWKLSVDKFKKDRDEVIKLIKDEKKDLTAVIPHTESHTYLREILLVAEHNAYHLGQVLTARKLLNDWK